MADTTRNSKAHFFEIIFRDGTFCVARRHEAQVKLAAAGDIGAYLGFEIFVKFFKKNTFLNYLKEKITNKKYMKCSIFFDREVNKV